MANAYSSPCNRKYTAANHSGARSLSQIKWVVIHSAEGRSALGVASYFSRPTTQASTHLAVDDSSCYRMLLDYLIPWGASGANTNGLHIELCGFARWNRAEWLARKTLLERSAFKVAMWCVKHKIPVRWVGPIGLKLGRKGLTTHVDVNKAFKRGHHWDPGPGFPKDQFLKLVKAYAKEIKEGAR